MSEWILSSSILILVVIALRTAFKGKISLRLQYAIWGLVLLRLLIPLNFGHTSFSVANLAEETPRNPVPSVSATTDLAAPTHLPEEMMGHVFVEKAEPVVHQAQTPEIKAATLLDFAPFIWAAGALSVAALFLMTNIRFKRKIMNTRCALDIRMNNLKVYATGEIDTPCLFGIRHPAIYVTFPVADNQTLLRHTLEHEATHHRHGDHIWAVLRCVCLAVHWYNPLVWWAAFLSQRDGELACDEATIKRLGEEERAEYGRTLIGMTCRKRANVLITATTMNSGKNGIKERILLIARKPKMAVYTLIAVVLAAVIAVGCTFTGAKEDSGSSLTGTKVFTSESEVTGMSIQALPAEFTRINSVYLSEMTQWALGFEYGEIIDSNAVMDPGSNTFSVTLYYADGTEQTCHLDFETVDGRTYAISREDVPSCWHEIWPDEETAQTQPPETQPPETETPDDAPPEGLPELFAKELDDNKVCIAVQPTGLVSEGGAYLYIVPEDQTTLLEYYQAATSNVEKYFMWDSTLRRSGWWIVYQGQWWQVAESGAMFGTDQETWEGIRIDADDAKQLYEFCDKAVKDAGIAEPVRPEELTDIKAATLYWNGVHTVTDEFTLGKLEKWFSNSRESGSASCWFTALLTLELENGETKTIAMATDSCAYYMTEGVAYGFGEITEEGINGNEEFYSLFAPSVIHEKSKEGIAAVNEYMMYLNWSLYANQYGVDETFALLDMIESWAAEEPTYNRFGGAIGWSTGLDGAYADYYAGMLARLYELAPSEFAWACLGNATDAKEKNTLEMLAYYWNITTEEARAKLAADIPQN